MSACTPTSRRPAVSRLVAVKRLRLQMVTAGNSRGQESNPLNAVIEAASCSSQEHHQQEQSPEDISLPHKRRSLELLKDTDIKD